MRFILTLMLAVPLLMAGAFGVFLLSMQMPPSGPDEHTDALVVLTGGSARVERGFALLAENAAPVLFISGVGPNVTQAEMLTAHTNRATREAILARDAEIVFDYEAQTTRTNASEAADFVRERGYKNIRLITGHYHMPRSLVEFHAALPGVTILREPVMPESLVRRSWWKDVSSRRLIWQEFLKYLAANGRILLDRVS